MRGIASANIESSGAWKTNHQVDEDNVTNSIVRDLMSKMRQLSIYRTFNSQLMYVCGVYDTKVYTFNQSWNSLL